MGVPAAHIDKAQVKPVPHQPYHTPGHQLEAALLRLAASISAWTVLCTWSCTAKPAFTACDSAVLRYMAFDHLALARINALAPMLATLVSPRKAIDNGSVKVMGKAGTQSAKPGGVCFI